MTYHHDLAALGRLMTLCEVGRDLALQTQTAAARALGDAQMSRERGEEAVAVAEREWRETVISQTLAPEYAGVAGETLIARATALDVATERERRAHRDLSDAEEARVEAEARLRQLDALHMMLRRKERRRMDQRILAQAEDRVMLAWGSR